MPKSTKKEDCIGYFQQPEFGLIAAAMAEYSDDPDAVLKVFKDGHHLTVLPVGGPDDDNDANEPDDDDDDAGFDNSVQCPGNPRC